MATRFSNSALVSEQLTVKTPTTDADWNKAVVERADQIVTMAIQCCTNTNALLGSAPNNVDEKTADAIERYFLFDVRDRKDKNLRNYLNKIQTTLIKAAAGLGCAALKIGDSVSKDKSKSVRGVVGGIRNQLFSSYAPFPEDWVPKNLNGQDPAGKPYKQKYYNAVVWQGDDDIKEGEIVVMRAIRLEAQYIFEKEIVQTLIHEATHKYEGTVDVALFDGAGKQLRPGQHLATVKDALKNADSYGWFAYLLGNAAKDG